MSFWSSARARSEGLRNPVVVGCGLVLVSALAAGAQTSPAEAARAADDRAAPVVAAASSTTGDDAVIGFLAQAKGPQLRTTTLPPATSSTAVPGAAAGVPGALVTPGALSVLPSGPLGIPGAVLAAYRRSADELAASTPGCRMSWSLLAGIGRIESGHARGGRVDAAGTTLGPILGPVLDGANPGDGVIRDTDGGRLDGNTSFDRAVGPMQFIPGTWVAYAADGNGDGVADPNNVYDASLASGKYLCSGGLDVSDPAQARTAVFRYNNSDAYVANVLTWAAAYARGVEPTDSEIGSIPAAVTPSAPAPTTEAPAPAPTTSATEPPATTGEVPTPTAPPATTTTSPSPDATTTPAPSSTPPPAAVLPQWVIPKGNGILLVCGAESLVPDDPADPTGPGKRYVAGPLDLCLAPALAQALPGYRALT